MTIRMTGAADPVIGSCLAIIKERISAGGVRAVLLNTDLLIKKGCLFSDDILIQGANQHGLVSLPDKTVIAAKRNRVVVEQRSGSGDLRR
ncbi:hypothetical protein [Loktanella fryxellensis]|nr:hypothetical protein [Loktanella fryxellensis]